MITSPQTNEDLIRRVREIRRQPGFVHPREGFWIADAVRKAVGR